MNNNKRAITLTKDVYNEINSIMQIPSSKFDEMGWGVNEAIKVYTYKFTDCYIEMALVTCDGKIYLTATLYDNEDSIVDDLEFESMPDSFTFGLYDFDTKLIVDIVRE